VELPNLLIRARASGVGHCIDRVTARAVWDGEPRPLILPERVIVVPKDTCGRRRTSAALRWRPVG
jgi:hypothetical protein